MLFFDGGLGLIMFGLWIFCIIDVITTPDGECRHLPKLLWLLIVVLIPDVGSIVWLVAGRNWNNRSANLTYRGNRGTGASTGASRRPSNPDDDEDFQALLRARAEEQRRRAREAEQRDEQPPPA